MRKLGTKLLFLLGLLSLALVIFTGRQTVQAATNGFQYENGATSIGNKLTDGQSTTKDPNAYNYNYGTATTDGVAFDDEGYVNYGDQAYLQKTVAENATKQGLFDVSLAVKGNNLSYPVDVVLVMDYSSTMKDLKEKAIAGVNSFINEISDVMDDGQVRIGVVAYNKNIYTTADMPNSEDGFLTNTDEIDSFMRDVAQAGSGTFLQGGLMEGEKMLREDPKDARKILVHIGDGRANQSYQANSSSALTPNNGEIVPANGQSVKAAYPTTFDTAAARLVSGSTVNAGEASITLPDTKTITDNTLGTILDTKNEGIDCYSIGTFPAVSPSSRGQFIDRNIASSAAKYRMIDDQLEDLGDALSAVASQVDNTIANGTVTDPMGEDILLQTTNGNFAANQDYTLVGARKDTNGDWVDAPDLVKNVGVVANNGTISMTNLRLGKDERVILKYQVRINTESNNFKPETWYLANGRTTLDPDVAYEDEANLLDFPVPSIKAPGVTLDLSKKWTNENKLSKRPDAIDFVINRSTNTSADAWTNSQEMSLNKANNWQAKISSVIPDGSAQVVALPKYNNVGDDYVYTAKEVNVPDGYESSVSTNDNQIVLTNNWTKEEETTKPTPDPDPEPKPDPKPNPDPDPSKPDPDSVEKETTENTKDQAKDKTTDQKKLPQANEQRNNTATVVGAVLLIVVVVLGGIWYRYKRRRN
ncbi:VWA domain-containing protein [Lapidilactobacillus wuchangensis]|uniref:VWA domain-containing protein n=1 Tax=Lapidilactobacillus wuchangensis TaxID=2486001 RepID=UPI000F76B8B8|nr:VWA domain-containing protein [Lapidilactobacillus wuchangensis]